MKLLLLVILTTASPVVFSQTQTENQPIRIESNGVQVYEATGVEGVVKISTETPRAENGINNWNIEQCEEVISYIKVKAQEGCSTKQAEVYTEQLQMLEERVKTLKSNNK